MRRILGVLLVLFTSLGGVYAAQYGQDGTFRQVINGTIDDNTPFTEIPFNVADDGSTIILDIIAVGDNPGNLDTFLYLLDSNGVIIDENDDRTRGDLTSRIDFPLAAAGSYTAIATRYGVAGGQSFGEFEMTIEVLPTTAPTTIDYDISPEALVAAGFPTVETRPQADWTIFAYYGGDNNLEWGLQNDFNEFELAGGSTENVRIVMLFDRSPEHSADNGDWQTMRIFEVQADVSNDATIRFPPTLDSEPIADLGPYDSGDGTTFAKFLVWGLRHFPADNYAVALASHGAGWRGIITDDSAAADIPRVPHTIISVPELTEAFRVATQTAGVERFNLLINDACSMSSVEYFTGVAPFFEMSLASPEIVVDPALDMTLFTNRLKIERQDVDLLDLAVELVDRYIDVDIIASGDLDADYFTHAVTDLTNFDPVTQAVENFARVFNSDPNAYADTLGAARVNTYTYTHFAGSTDKVDLGSLMRRVIAEARDAELIRAAEAVLTALDAAILYNNAGANIGPEISYYNIHFPEASSGFRATYLNESTLTEWGRMLRNYYNAVTPQIWAGSGIGLPFHPPKAPTITVGLVYPEGEVSVASPFNIRIQVEGRNISHGDATHDFIQQDGTIIRYGSERILRPIINEAGESTLINQWNDGLVDDIITWDVALPVVSDGNSSNNELVIIRESVAFLDGVYRGPNDTNFYEVSVVFSNALNELDGVGRTQRVISRATGSNALAVITIPPGSEFIAYRSVVTPDGRVVQEEGNRYIWPDAGLTYSNEPAPNGQYNVGVLLEAFGGTTGYVSATTTVNNDNFGDSDLRATTSLGIGFSFTRPKTWSFLATDFVTFADRSVSPDGTSSISVYYPDPSFIEPGNIETIVDDVFLFYFPDVEWDRQYSEVVVDGKSAITFDFSYQNAQGTVNARAIAVLDSVDSSGFVFTSEAQAGTGDINAIYDQLLANLKIFPSIFSQDESDVLWDLSNYTRRGRQPFTPEVTYPIPYTWVQNQQGDWTRYEDTPGSVRFVAFSTLESTNLNAALDLVVARDVLPGAEAINTSIDRTLNTRNHRWLARPYTVTRGGLSYQGRVYATVANNQVYLIWVEAPDDEFIPAVYERFFEPMVDGFSIGNVEAQ